MLLELGPQVLLEAMLQGPPTELEEAALVSIKNIVKLVAERFERH
jgi:hypothetical protein